VHHRTLSLFSRSRALFGVGPCTLTQFIYLFFLLQNSWRNKFSFNCSVMGGFLIHAIQSWEPKNPARTDRRFPSLIYRNIAFSPAILENIHTSSQQQNVFAPWWYRHLRVAAPLCQFLCNGIYATSGGARPTKVQSTVPPLPPYPREWAGFQCTFGPRHKLESEVPSVITFEWFSMVA